MYSPHPDFHYWFVNLQVNISHNFILYHFLKLSIIFDAIHPWSAPQDAQVKRPLGFTK